MHASCALHSTRRIGPKCCFFRFFCFLSFQTWAQRNGCNVSDHSSTFTHGSFSNAIYHNCPAGRLILLAPLPTQATTTINLTSLRMTLHLHLSRLATVSSRSKRHSSGTGEESRRRSQLVSSFLLSPLRACSLPFSFVRSFLFSMRGRGRISSSLSLFLFVTFPFLLFFGCFSVLFLSFFSSFSGLENLNLMPRNTFWNFLIVSHRHPLHPNCQIL